jgi:hypothetical protein
MIKIFILNGVKIASVVENKAANKNHYTRELKLRGSELKRYPHNRVRFNSKAQKRIFVEKPT